jgi:hypothetical protein
MDTSQELEALFSVFYDAYIEEATIEGTRIRLKIGITYLVELIDPKYQFVFLELDDVELVEYHAWADTTLVLTNWTAIFDLGIEILSAELGEFGRVEVHSKCDDALNDLFEGGTLILKCKNYKLFDEGDQVLSLKTLENLSSTYWKKSKKIG